jgi:hypothetical protein
MKAKFILYGFAIFGGILLPIALKKDPKKDWIIVFLLLNTINGLGIIHYFL